MVPVRYISFRQDHGINTSNSDPSSTAASIRPENWQQHDEVKNMPSFQDHHTYILSSLSVSIFPPTCHDPRWWQQRILIVCHKHLFTTMKARLRHTGKTCTRWGYSVFNVRCIGYFLNIWYAKNVMYMAQTSMVIVWIINVDNYSGSGACVDEQRGCLPHV